MTERIASLVRCRACGDAPDPDCQRCGGLPAGLRWFNDPVSYDGCLPGCDLDHPAGEHCSEPVGNRDG